jgi:hypothetical protein
LTPTSVGVFLELLFDLENGVDMYLRNVWPLSELHGLATQKTVLFIVTAAITSDSIYW